MNNIQFLGDNGLSSSSANYIANKAKEKYQDLESKLNNIRLYKKDIKLLSNNSDSTPIALETSKDIFNIIPSMLSEIAQLKSLIAICREGLKSKKDATFKIKNMSFPEWCRDIKSIEQPVCPDQENSLTEEEYYNSLSIKERNRYYCLETIVSVIGKYIHSDGEFSKARMKYLDNQQNPIMVEGRGNDTIIYTYSSTYTNEEIEDMFFKLQSKHREYQAELNGMKHACEIAIEKDYAEKHTTYLKKYAEYQKNLKELQDEWLDYIKTETNRIAALKIVIPNSLQEIYNKVNSLGK